MPKDETTPPFEVVTVENERPIVGRYSALLDLSGRHSERLPPRLFERGWSEDDKAGFEQAANRWLAELVVQRITALVAKTEDHESRIRALERNLAAGLQPRKSEVVHPHVGDSTWATVRDKLNEYLSRAIDALEESDSDLFAVYNACASLRSAVRAQRDKLRKQPSEKFRRFMFGLIFDVLSFNEFEEFSTDDLNVIGTAIDLATQDETTRASLREMTELFIEAGLSDMPDG